MKKTLISMAISGTSLLTATSATAAFPDPAIINFDPGAKVCVYGTSTSTTTGCKYNVVDTTGSWFSMDADGSGSVSDSEKTVISQNGGLFVDGITIQVASGSHSGASDGTESPDIDAPWFFFSNTGMHQTTSPIVIIENEVAGSGIVTLDWSGWDVTWNGIASIPMGGDPGNFPSDTSIATMTCALDCADGDTYTLDYQAHVPIGDPSNFGGVPYALHLEGTIGLPPTINIAPEAKPDSFTVDRGTSLVVLGVLNNDKDLNGRPDIDLTSVITTGLTTTTNGGTISTDLLTGDVIYTPPTPIYLGPDDFTYNVTDLGGPSTGNGIPLPSNEATVTIDVVNAIPVAVNDSASLDITAATSVDIDVVVNDTDSDGFIDVETVTITGGPVDKDGNVAGIANRVVDPDTGLGTGAITYTPDAGFIGDANITYTVDDNDAATSNAATATITVFDPTIVGIPENAFLTITAGDTDGSTKTEPADGKGSWFHMEVAPGVLTFVSLAGFDSLAMGVGNYQLGSVPFPKVDNPWNFFGNLGVHQTTSDVLRLADDGKGTVTLNLSGWDVSWNNIASIPMSSRAHTTGFSDGVAQVSCTAGADGVADCSYGDNYILEYSATVPDGDPSNFGNVKYFVHLEGVISVDGLIPVGGGDPTALFNVTEMTAIDENGIDIATAPGSVAGSVGNTTGINLSPADVKVKDPRLNTGDGQQCIGGCIDFVVTNVTTDYVDLTFKLSEALPSGVLYRKLLNGVWQDFDQSQGDIIGSAASDAATGDCQRPEGIFSSGLREGFDCIYMRIYDNGRNDADSAVGTIADPSGALFAGSPNVPAGSSSSGCSISSTKVSLMERADWLIVAGFISWLGLIGYRRNKKLN